VKDPVVLMIPWLLFPSDKRVDVIGEKLVADYINSSPSWSTL